MTASIITKTAMATRGAAKLGETCVDLQAMYGLAPAVFVHLNSGAYTGLSVTIHGSVEEVRNLAVQLMRHAKAAERAQQVPA
ncbi:hypothetical protein [Dyella japonica]|uniref:Uncharacterized protein n=1 Tax=Dyella japonica TaxID=231455 RepID=A0ABV2K1X1_9GAMM